MKGRLYGLTGALLLFALVNIVVVNLALWLTGSHTTLHHTAAFLLGRAGDDSWQPMRLALDYVHGAQAKPLYSALFFDRGVDFIYPPTSLLLLEPLRSLSPGGGPSNVPLNLLAWLAVAGTALITARLFHLSVREHLRPDDETSPTILAATAVAFTLTFYPVVKAFTLGQIQTWITFMFAGASLAWMTGRRGAAGLLSGLMAIVKPQLGLLLIWGLLRKQTRFVQGWALVVIPLAAMSVWSYGWANHWDYVQMASFISKHSWAYHANQSVNGLLNRLLFNGSNVVWDPRAVPYNTLVYVGTVAGAGALVGMALFWRPADHRDGGLVDFFIAGLTCTMASPVAWEHHYGMMMPVFACVLPLTLARRESNRASVALLASAFVLSSNLWEWTDRTAGTRLNVVQSYLFFGGVLLLVHLYRMRRGSDLRARI